MWTKPYGHDIMRAVIKVLEEQDLNIAGIFSVALIQPDKAEKRKKYDKNVPKYQLIYKISGEVTTHFNGKTAQITPGMVYIIPKCSDADYYIERRTVGDCIDIFFDTNKPLLDELFCLDFSSSPRIYDLFQKVYKLWISKADGYYYKCLSIVYEILYEMVLKSKKYIPNNKYKQIESGIEYIKAHLYDRDIDYYLPSKICGISYTYFKSLFIEKFGVPPIRYVTSLRLERAKELLLTNQYSVSEIAALCGFENVYYFSKMFKEKYQYAPTVYKKTLQ